MRLQAKWLIEGHGGWRFHLWVFQDLSQKLDKNLKGKEGRKTSFKVQVHKERLNVVPQGTGNCSLSSTMGRKSRFSVHSLEEICTHQACER